MSTFMKMTIHIHPHRYDDFMDALTTYVVPMNEDNGLMLQASFVEVMGALKPTIIHDIWEAEDGGKAVNDLLTQVYAKDTRWDEYSKRVKDIIVYEEMRFMIKAAGRMKSFFEETDVPRGALFTEESEYS